jgi:hypothetical protein
MKEKTKIFLFILLFLFTIFSAVLIAFTAAKYNWDKSLSLLAVQFIKGHVSLAPTIDLPVGDISIFNGKYYMYFGPLASIILMPFVAFFGKSFPQLVIGLGTLAVSFFAIYSISRSFKFSKIDALWLCLFFVFSTVLFSNSIINITSYLVEALGVPLVLLSLVEYFGKKRPLLVGLFLGLAVLTRITLILALVFFVLEFVKKRFSKQQFLLFLLPFSFCLIFYGGYNYLRFHSFLETGYSYHIAHPYPLSKNYEYGEMNIIHLPANLYSFFIKPPDPILYYSKGFVFRFPYLKANPWGMAIWFTSPLFLLLFRFKKNKYTLSSAVATLFLAAPLFTYFSVGFAQFGYRYALDFLPFIFLLLIPQLLPKLSKTAITLITIGVIFNCIYITSLWDVYPLLGIYK